MHVWSAVELGRQLSDLGLGRGDAVMAHASLRAVGAMVERGKTLVAAIMEAIGGEGTLIAYTDWRGGYEHLLDAEGRLDDALRAAVAPFDPDTSPAIPDNGALAEIVRTWPGAMRSGSPGPSVAAVGARAAWFVRDHALDYGYGERSPFARLVETEGKVLMVGAPLDTMTLLHHAEHRAAIPGKRIRRYEAPFRQAGGVVWKTIEEYDTGDPVVEGLPDDYFATIVEEFLASGGGRRGIVGNAPAVLVPARAMVAFAVAWLERRF